MKKLALFHAMATFKHLSKQAGCWLEQTNMLCMLLVYSASHRLFSPKASTLHQSIPDWKGAPHTAEQQGSISSCYKSSWALLITNSTLPWQDDSLDLSAGTTSSAWKPGEPFEPTQLVHAFPRTACTFLSLRQVFHFNCTEAEGKGKHKL